MSGFQDLAWRLGSFRDNEAYSPKVLATSPKRYWPLWDLSGTAATELIAGDNGTYNGVTLNQPGIGDGRRSAFFDSVDYCTIYSAALSTNPNLNLIRNANFGQYTGTQDDGTSDVIASWTNGNVNDGLGNRVEATATVHGGSNAVKIQRTTATVNCFQDIPVVAGTIYDLSFWTRGDGSQGARYAVYDITNSAFIIGTTVTGITGTNYTQITNSFTAPVGCSSVRIYMYSPAAAGTGYFDDWSVLPRTGNGFNPAAGTLMAWIKVPDAAWIDGEYRAVIRIAADTGNMIELFKDNTPFNKMEALYYGSFQAATSAEAENVNSALWQNWILTWSVADNELLLYKDGVLASIQAGATMLPWQGFLSSTVGCFIGAGYIAAGGLHWSGNLAHIALWDRVITEAERPRLATV